MGNKKLYLQEDKSRLSSGCYCTGKLRRPLVVTPKKHEQLPSPLSPALLVIVWHWPSTGSSPGTLASRLSPLAPLLGPSFTSGLPKNIDWPVYRSPPPGIWPGPPPAWEVVNEETNCPPSWSQKTEACPLSAPLRFLQAVGAVPRAGFVEESLLSLCFPGWGE